MADQLFLSYRLRNYSAENMIRQFEKMLRIFPFSKLTQAGATLRVNAVAFQEPPVFERAYAATDTLESILQDVTEFQRPDCAATVDGWWDLWQFDEGEWQVLPARVSLISIGPEFETEMDDQLRIDLGIDAHFLPQPELPNAAFMTQSNVRSLLHLVHELDDKLPVDSRRLWTESGENFADRLKQVLTGETPGPRLVK